MTKLQEPIQKVSDNFLLGDIISRSTPIQIPTYTFLMDLFNASNEKPKEAKNGQHEHTEACRDGCQGYVSEQEEVLQSFAHLDEAKILRKV